jgi:hypothetical protein
MCSHGVITTWHVCFLHVLLCVSCLQAINGGNATWFGVNVPFDLNTLLAIVSNTAAGSRCLDYGSMLAQRSAAVSHTEPAC